MINAFDVDSYNKPGFNFGAAFNAGYRAGYLKLGGDNLSPRYRGTGYLKQFDAFAGAGFEHRGSYWVTGGSDPVASARFYLANIDPRTTFDVLDNEDLDDGRPWSDAEASAFFDVLIAAGRKNLFQYGSRDSLWNTHTWPGLEARGIKAIVALYNNAPFTNVNPRTYPAELVAGHQFTSSASIGGLGAIDANAFADDAFVGGGITPEEEDEGAIMKPNIGHYKVGGVDNYIQFVPGTKWILEWTEVGGNIATGLVRQQDHPADAVEITKSMRDAIVAAAAKA